MTSTIRRHDAVRYFSDSYAQARERFLDAACRGARMASYPIEARGARDEALSTDVALIGDAKAERLLIMTSATHGAEGFCGSGWPCWTMRRCWRARAIPAWPAAGARGQSPWLFVDCAHRRGQRRPEPQCPALRWPSLPENPGYGALHPLLLPESWPPTEANRREQERYIAEHGLPPTPRPSRAGSTRMPTACSMAAIARRPRC